VVAGIGIVSSIIGTFFVRVKEGGDPQKALNLGELVAAAIMLICTWFAVTTVLPGTWAKWAVIDLHQQRQSSSPSSSVWWPAWGLATSQNTTPERALSPYRESWISR
jgi:hypothetical protein